MTNRKMASKLTNPFVTKSIPELYLNSKTADVHFSFATDDGIVKVPAHKAILAIANPVFEAMFFGELKENNVVEIVDANASAFAEFLQLFYLPEVTFTMENIDVVLSFADKYDMIECTSCADFLENQLTKLDKIVWVYQVAISINNQKLKESCERQIELLTNEVFKTDAFLHCDKSVVEHILRLESLRSSEFHVFLACIEWAKTFCRKCDLDENDPENLKKQLDGCLQLIRFDGMSNDEIGKIIANEQYEKLFTRHELTELFRIKMIHNFRSNVFKQAQRTLKWNSDKVLRCDLKIQKHSSSDPEVPLQAREST